MTINQLKYVLALYKYKNFTTAAEKSLVSQPSLSMQVQKLEKKLNTKIFDRSVGTSGHCWEIFAKAKSKPDVEFAIPTCWLHHNPDIWVKPKNPWHQKKTEEQLRIDTEFLEGVRCSF